MFKLTVVGGRSRGTTYALAEGEVWIGRQVGNTIVLESSRVSKRHCRLVVSDGKVVLEDQGSANGTFVNGSLVKDKDLQPGDKISVGDFIFQLSRASKRKKARALPGEMAEIVRIPTAYAPGKHPLSIAALGNARLPGNGAGDLDMGGASTRGPEPIPAELPGKVLWFFDNRIMPYFHNLAFKNEWSKLGAGLMGVFLIANLGISVYPLFETNRATTIRELKRRARVIAQQAAERNAPAIAADAKTKLDIGSLDRLDGVRLTVITDLDLRVLAPSTSFNKVLGQGSAATTAAKMAKAYKRGEERGFVGEADSETVIAVEPIKIYSPQLARNVVAAMAVVSMDSTLTTTDVGEMGLTYAQTLLITALFGGFLALVFYRVTLKPLQVLNEDIDRALKGEISQVTHEFKWQELNPLWDVINSALTRAAPVGSDPGASLGLASPMQMAEDFTASLGAIATLTRAGLVVCDNERRIASMNFQFEEISGIRADGAVGQEISSVARDQAFVALCSDLFDRASVGGAGATEDFDFSGQQFKVHGFALGTSGGPVRAYVLWVVLNA